MCEKRLFRGPHSALHHCDLCGEPRYKEMMPGYIHRAGSVATYTPRKVYRYFPIAHRLRQLLAHPIYSKLFRHGERMMAANKDSNCMEDIYTSTRWKKMCDSLPLHGERPDKPGVCDLRIGFVLSADGASMSKFNSAEFSLTPFILSLLNWPVKVRTKVQHLLFTGISPMNNKATAIYLGKHSCIYTFN